SPEQQGSEEGQQERRQEAARLVREKQKAVAHQQHVRRPFYVVSKLFEPNSEALSVVIRHMPDTALSRLMAVGIAAGCPQNAREKDSHDNRYNDEWGSDVHVQSLTPRLSEHKQSFTPHAILSPRGFIMVPPAFCSSGATS